MITERYRKDYDGEFILLDTKFVDGKKIQEREWVDNPLVLDLKSPRAAVVGSSVDRELFDYTKLENHVGGLRGCLSLTMYGVGDVWKDMKFTHLVASSDSVVKEIANTEYSEETIVYATSRQCIEYPGKFFIVPHQPLICPLAMAVYLAAFDGYQEVYLLGYNQETPAEHKNWIQDISAVIAAYAGTKFVLVGVPAAMPDEWRNLRNVRTMRYTDFISHCDV